MRLHVEGLEKSFGDKHVLCGANAVFEQGTVYALLGRNGAGKTTSFYMICGLIKPTSGDIKLDDKIITQVPLHKRALQGIGYLPQESSVFKELSVEENLLLAAEVSIKDKIKASQKVDEMLELLNITAIKDRLGISLSGGERRRCEIARSLVITPKFLLLDEPFAGVDPIAVADIQNIVKNLKKLDIGILITDHNVRETLAICDRAYVMKDGEILAGGSSDEVANDENVRKYYLGEEFKFF